MAIDISAYVTNNFPSTEAKLIAESAIDYPAIKAAEIAKAKRRAYGTATVPAEADIPDLVGEWIADRATIGLIPVAKEHYSLARYLQKSTKDGNNVQQYDLLRMLDGLAAELERECAEKWPRVEDLIGRSFAPRETPAISTEGLMLDPADRAWNRGVPA